MRCYKTASLFLGIVIISGPLYAENNCWTTYRNSEAQCVQAKKDCTAAAVNVRDTCKMDNQAAKAQQKGTTTTGKPKTYTHST